MAALEKAKPGRQKKELAKREEGPINFKLSLHSTELNLIRQHIAPEATAGEFALFIYDAQSRGLNPLKKQIYFVKYAGKPSHQVSIDGYRSIAESTGKYDGQTAVVYGDDIHYKGTDKVVPEWAEVGIFRKGSAHPFIARVYFEEFAQTFKGVLGSQWAQRPRHMLAKCAESLALRKAFPEQLAGLYTTSEMAEDEMPAVEVNVVTDNIEVEAEKPENAGKAFDITINRDKGTVSIEGAEPAPKQAPLEPNF